MEIPELDTKIGRNPEVVSTKVGDQTMMMSIQQGQYYALEATGARIWDLLDPARSLREVVDILVEEYAISEQQCSDEVMRFAGQMLQDGLVVEIADG